MFRLAALVVPAVIAVGVIGTALALSGRGNDTFRYEQENGLHLRPQVSVTPADVASALAARTGSRRGAREQIRCRPHGGGPLRDPWSCETRNSSGATATYRLTVQPNGRYRGTGRRAISGCCVKTPMRQ